MQQKTKIFSICTGDYKYGVFALINSIRHCGIINDIIIGTDKIIPELEHIIGVEQLIIESEWNGLNLKSTVILESECDHFVFFDSDIIVTSADFFKEIELLIIKSKFVVCIDGIVSGNEYRRMYWNDIYPSTLAKREYHNFYYNSGFFAGSYLEHNYILKDWKKLTQKYLDPKAYLFDNPKLPMADQDLFNAIIQTLPLDNLVSLQMPDWRAINLEDFPFFHIGNFRPHAFLHCTGNFKPWKIKKVPAQSPTLYDELWFKYVTDSANPIMPKIIFPRVLKLWFKRNILSRILVKIKKTFH